MDRQRLIEEDFLALADALRGIQTVAGIRIAIDKSLRPLIANPGGVWRAPTSADYQLLAKLLTDFGDKTHRAAVQAAFPYAALSRVGVRGKGPAPLDIE